MRNYSKNTCNWETQIIIALITGWMFSFLLISQPKLSAGLTYTVEQSFRKTIMVILIFSIASFVLGIWKPKMQHILLPVSVFLASVVGMETINQPWVVLGFSVAILLSMWYVKEDILYYTSKIKITNQALKVFFWLLGIFLFVFIGSIGCMRYFSFNTPSTDLGIFSQMLSYMKETGNPLTTLERNGLLSHFKVHISPILYLVLPFYMIYSSPLTLQLLQAFFVAISIWPLYLLGKHYKMGNKSLLAIGVCYTCYPALSGSCFFDFHENAFLPFFLLFLIVAIEKKKDILFLVFLIATLFIKEDAAIQLIFLAFFYILSKKDRKRGSIMLIIASTYFIAALAVLNKGGLGLLEYMNNMYLTESGNAMQIIKTAIMNPGYTLRQCFDIREKIDYLVWILLPLSIAIIPKKNYTFYLLLCPFVLLNLIPDYSCVYSIYFQYSFSITVFLFYIAIMNLKEWKAESKRYFLLLASVITIFMFLSSSWSVGGFHKENYCKGKEVATKIEAGLALIPTEASVGGSNLLVSHLWEHKELYLPFEGNTDYVVVDLRPGEGADEPSVREQAKQSGYREIYYEKEILIIFSRD